MTTTEAAEVIYWRGRKQWQAVCPCGWDGFALRSWSEAKREVDDHNRNFHSEDTAA